MLCQQARQWLFGLNGNGGGRGGGYRKRPLGFSRADAIAMRHDAGIVRKLIGDGIIAADFRPPSIMSLRALLPRFSLLPVFVLAALLTANAFAERPRIGLVLGGGGARGAAHIGVLEMLEAAHVPVDCVAGTSMGALVAGAWVAGMSPEKMRAALGGVDWEDLFVDYPEFSEMSHRNKTISRRYLPGSESGVSVDGIKYQSSVIGGQKIKLFFNQLVGADRGERRMEELPIPLAIVATDIGNGERVAFTDGSLSQAMRASMAVPGLIAPVDYRGRKLVDGGLVDNLPVAEARRLCQADVVIAVDVGSPLLKAEEVGSLLTISAQMIRILTQQNVARSLAELNPGDVLIRPDLQGVTAGDFAKSGLAANRGRAAANGVMAQLEKLALPHDEYEAWRAEVAGRSRRAPKIDEVRIVGLKQVNPQAVERHLHVVAGDTVDVGSLNRDLQRMYGDGWYESVDYALLTERERHVLRVAPAEKHWGPDYFRLGLNLQADNSQGSTFSLRGAYHQTWLNSLGGEILYAAELGTRTALETDYHQPLDSQQRWFVQTQAVVGRERINIYQEDRPLAQYLSTEGALRFYLGRNVGLLGPVRAGWVQRRRQDALDIGEPSLWPRGDVDYGGWQLRADFDQFDRLYFPTRGWSASLSWFQSPQQNYARVDADLRGAYSFGGTVLNARLRYTGSPRSNLPAYDAGTLGGFLNMTAFASKQIIGDDIRYAGVNAERIIGRLPLGLRGDMRIGLALEAAEVGHRYTETRRDGLINSTAIYIGGETPFGPTYLGFGYASGGVSNLFLFVGTP